MAANRHINVSDKTEARGEERLNVCNCGYVAGEAKEEGIGSAGLSV